MVRSNGLTSQGRKCSHSFYKIRRIIYEYNER